MSKLEKALEWFKGNKGLIDPYEFPQEHQEVFEELLSKAIPKKPLGNFCQELCPNCGEESCRTEYASRYEYKHCPNCGQALDWD